MERSAGLLATLPNLRLIQSAAAGIDHLEHAAIGELPLRRQQRFVGRQQVVQVYTDNAAVVAAALPLLAWVALFHTVDAAQAVAAFVLRAWRVATVPTLIYVLALWGVGLGGGNWLAFNLGGQTPADWQGARGFWIASTAGLILAALLLTSLMVWTTGERSRRG